MSFNVSLINYVMSYLRGSKDKCLNNVLQFSIQYAIDDVNSATFVHFLFFLNLII